MIKKKVKYLDFEGNEKEETLYFHMNEYEILQLGFNFQDGDIVKHFQNLLDENKEKEIAELLVSLINNSYGIRSENGSSFYKSEEIKYEFKSSDFYGPLIRKLLTNVDEATEFMNGLAPHGIKHLLPNDPEMDTVLEENN